jgi:hypothetical protein
MGAAACATAWRSSSWRAAAASAAAQCGPPAFEDGSLLTGDGPQVGAEQSLVVEVDAGHDGG